jgi:hypothetical protein
LKQPDGKLIIDGAYYPFSSLLYYSGRDALLLNGRFNNLEYGSYAPGAARVFINDEQFAQLWLQPGRCYLAAEGPQLARLKQLVGSGNLEELTESGGKFLFTNQGTEAATGVNKENPGR